jgi:hypothetical protein
MWMLWGINLLRCYEACYFLDIVCIGPIDMFFCDLLKSMVEPKLLTMDIIHDGTQRRIQNFDEG